MNTILYIEPAQPPSKEPVTDWFTAKVRKLERQSERVDHIRGIYFCKCGYAGGNFTLKLPNGAFMSCLAEHYVTRHRSEVPDSERLKIVEMMTESLRK